MNEISALKRKITSLLKENENILNTCNETKSLLSGRDIELKESRAKIGNSYFVS